MTEFEFDRLLDLYKKNRLTAEEKKMVDDWFQQMDSGAETPLNDADKNRLKRNILQTISNSGDASIESHVTSDRESPRWTWLKVAASVSIIFVFGWLTWRFAFAPEELKSYASSGTVTKIALPDGSLVWLKGQSSLQAPLVFDSQIRKVFLEGEALFEVAKDAKHPFVIQCGQVTTTVLGTSFNLKALSGSVELTVLTGKVSLTSTHDKTGIVVMPNEKVIFDARKSLIASEKILIEEKLATTDGTEYQMIFNDVALDKVFERIEKKFDVKISLSDEGLRQCKIRADFSDQSLENTLDMICQALDFHYVINDKEVRLTGEKCN